MTPLRLGQGCFWPTVDVPYRKLMAKLGMLIGRCPLPFLLLPSCISLCLVYPFLEGLRDYKKFAVTRAGAIELFTPVDSWAQNQKQKMESIFTDGGYFSDRTVISPTLFILLVSAKDGGTVLRDDVANEYSTLRTSLESMIFILNNTVYDYKRLCSVDLDNVKCQPDPFMTLWNLRKNGILRHITYPFVNFSDVTSSNVKLFSTEFYIGPLFGGVKTDSSDKIMDAKFVRLILNIPRNNYSDELLSAFGRTFVDYVESYRSDLIEINYWSSMKYIDDMQLISRRVIKLLPILIGLLLMFALASCCMRDSVLSQPWLAVCGIISASLGIQCGYAILFLLRVQLIEIAMIVPFLVLSIGVDDTFVMLNVWRQTNSDDDVPTRLSHTFAEAAVSITITSLTDVAAFVIGISSVFPSVRIFCSFSACTLATMFTFQITFFGACMVYTGRREAAGRHCIFFNKVSTLSENDGFMKRFLCYTSAGVLSEKSKSLWQTKPFLTLFFENTFSNWICRPKVKLAVGVTYALYLGGAVYCLISYMVLGLQVSNLVPYNSDTHKYLSLYETYFTKCSTSAELVIAETLKYDDKLVQENLLATARNFEFTEFTYKTDFWLKEFLEFSRSLQTPLNADTFYHLLTDVFLTAPKYRKYSADINFACCTSSASLGVAHRPYVNTSRFYVQLINMGYENRSRAMHVLKEKVGQQNFSLFVYDVSFPLAEQYDSILSGAVVDIVVGVGCMLLSALIFVPNLLNCLCIAFTVFSINVGVLGFMAVCGIHLDIISLITILLSIGFSVDYSAHVAYHYHTVDDDRASVKVQQALGTVGGPILQSSLSMLLGILTVIGVKAYIADTFFITVCLVMVIGVYHSLIVLPVLLSVVSPGKSLGTCESTNSDKFIKPDPMLKFRFMQMQRQNQTESWTQSRHTNVDYKNRPIPLQIRPIDELIDEFNKEMFQKTLDQLSNCTDVETGKNRRRDLFAGDNQWLVAWIHGEMGCSSKKGKYCAYCEIVKEITRNYTNHEKSSSHSLKSYQSSKI